MLDQLFTQISVQLAAFIRYLVSLWGILSAVSAFFPLADGFAKVIPPPRVQTKACVLLATLSCIVVIFIKFVNRRNLLSGRPSLRPFFIAVVVTLAYVFVLPAWPSLSPHILLGQPNRPEVVQFFVGALRAVSKLVAPTCYIYMFYKFTDAFTTLAVQEWQSREHLKARGGVA